MDLLKLYIYGYLNRVRSSRRLEAETHRNIEVIWLLRHLKPDFKVEAGAVMPPRPPLQQHRPFERVETLYGSAATPVAVLPTDSGVTPTFF
jgi:hypothetical protein